MEYTLKKTIESDNFIIRVYSPVISEEERKRRMKEIYKAAENLLKKVHAK
jgi:ribosome recycling factor